MLADTVADVAQKEGYTLERAAAELVALLAEGSFRDALSILQKVLSVAQGKKIQIGDVEDVSGAPRGELIRTLLSAIAKKDAQAALSVVRTAEKDNMDARTLAKLLIHRLRVILLMRYAPDLSESLADELTEADREIAGALTKEPGINSDTLRSVLDAYGKMAYAAVPFLPLELAIIDLCAAK
jgi:DNA polymerase-3 subunit gamma/tau